MPCHNIVSLYVVLQMRKSVWFSRLWVVFGPHESGEGGGGANEKPTNSISIYFSQPTSRSKALLLLSLLFLLLYMIFESYNELAAVVNDSFTFFINLVSSPHEKKKKHLA